MKLLPLIVAAIFAGLAVLGDNYTKAALPSEIVADAERSAEYFLQYRTGVATFQRNNPGYIGAVPAASLAALGYQFPQEFLATAGNGITATGATGRVVTVFASLPAGAVSDAVKAADGDTSIGLAGGANWTSYVGGVTAPLAIAVPNGAVVSVIQIGN